MKTDTIDSKAASTNLSQDLFIALKKNDQSAQLKVYKLYYNEMYNISLRIVLDPMVAEEIMQESFLDAFEQISKYSENSPFVSWVKCLLLKRCQVYLMANNPGLNSSERK